MSNVVIVTDSTACIPADLTKDLPIVTVPLHITWGDKSYLDEVELRPQDFYERLKVDPTLPKTSQITPGEFLKVYQELVEKGKEILSLHFSSKMSNSINSAVIARRTLSQATIEVVDSFTGSMGLGFQVLAAARAAVQGASLQDCKELADKARQRTNIFFIPGTLEFLHRGGRVSNMASLLGSILDIKPILETRDGSMMGVERVRTMKHAVNRVVELVDQKIGSQTPIHLAGLHSNAPELGMELLEKTKQCLGADRICESFLTDISPVLGTHIGPGAVGMTYMVGM